jgi:hypothetical protein
MATDAEGEFEVGDVGDYHLMYRPACVYVQFFKDTECLVKESWTVGSLASGIYPIKCRSETWELAPNSKGNPQNIRRTQLPILPD